MKTVVDALALNNTLLYYTLVLCPDTTPTSQKKCGSVASSRLIDSSLLVRSCSRAVKMPPRSSPHKLRVPILRKHTWCMTWADGDFAALHPIVVQCYAETYDGKNWKHCNHLHKPCESVRCCYGLCLLSMVIRADIPYLRFPKALREIGTNFLIASLGLNR